MVPPEDFKQQLKEKLANNEISGVISSLRKIIFSNSVKFSELHLIAFNFNSLKQQFREGTLNVDKYNQEVNLIRKNIYGLIEKLEEEEIYLYHLESDDVSYENIPNESSDGTNNSNGSGNKRFRNAKRKARKFFRYVKTSVVALMMGFLFLVNGSDIIGVDPIVADCEPELSQLKSDARNKIVDTEITACFDLLDERLSKRKSPKYEEIVLLRSRFNHNETTYRKNLVDRDTYLKQRSTIVDILLQLISELDCGDL